MDKFIFTLTSSQPHLTPFEVRFTFHQSSNLVARSTPEVAP